MGNFRYNSEMFLFLNDNVISIRKKEAEQSLAPERKGRAGKWIAVSSSLGCARLCAPLNRGRSAFMNIDAERVSQKVRSLPDHVEKTDIKKPLSTYFSSTSPYFPKDQAYRRHTTR